MACIMCCVAAKLLFNIESQNEFDLYLYCCCCCGSGLSQPPFVQILYLSYEIVVTPNAEPTLIYLYV